MEKTERNNNLETKEKELKIQTRVILEFIRHGEKDVNSSKWDKKRRLTEKGREMAQEKGHQLNPQSEVSLGWASRRERTQETVLHSMLPDIDKNATMEDMEKLITEEQKFGKKIIIDPRLDFILGIPGDEEAMRASKDNRGLRYLIEKSDLKAIETNDKISSTYTRAAANISEIIYRYVKIGGTFNRLALNNPRKYENLGNQLERYLGTSQGTVECFVAKLLEEIYGIEKRDEFLDSLGNGFGETQGIRVEFINDGNEQKIVVSYELNGKKEIITLNLSDLEKIMDERNALEQKIDEKSKQ